MREEYELGAVGLVRGASEAAEQRKAVGAAPVGGELAGEASMIGLCHEPAAAIEKGLEHVGGTGREGHTAQPDVALGDAGRDGHLGRRKERPPSEPPAM